MTTRVRPRLRDLTSADAERVAEITGVFRDEELRIAAEVFADAVAAAEQARDGSATGELPYYTLGAELDGRLCGWICWGATPCTEGTWDLYWLAVDPAAQGAGLGTALVEEMERRLPPSARLISVDTSGRQDYAPTRRFYEARGYRAVAVVPDFYARGDDQVIFTKKVG
jgi:ribosomal protein S18 acetylase RimI-like enzyme